MVMVEEEGAIRLVFVSFLLFQAKYCGFTMSRDVLDFEKQNYLVGDAVEVGKRVKQHRIPSMNC